MWLFDGDSTLSRRETSWEAVFIMIFFKLELSCVKRVEPQTNVKINKKENCILPKISLITDAYE